VVLPSAESIVASFGHELTWFLDREIKPKVSRLQEQIESSGGSPKAINRLGIFYARYGMYEEAEAELKKTLIQQEYVPALVNLGHVARLKGDRRAALDYYDRALRVNPDSIPGLLASAQLHHEMENYGLVGELYRKLKELDPKLAQRFSYLGLRGEEASRAAEIGNVKGVVEWDEE
jgi:tetratricopeptide (TPR) repeat protein